MYYVIVFLALIVVIAVLIVLRTVASYPQRDEAEQDGTPAAQHVFPVACEGDEPFYGKKSVRAKTAGERQQPSVPLTSGDRPGACGESESA